MANALPDHCLTANNMKRSWAWAFVQITNLLFQCARAQIVQGLKELHARRQLHNDLKPGNVLTALLGARLRRLAGPQGEEVGFICLNLVDVAFHCINGWSK
jgi:serine/threonine protein kinase